MLDKLLLTMGTFDVPHIGHAIFLKKCEAYTRRIVVGVNTDEFVEKYRGKPPVFPYIERLSLIADLGYEVRPNKSAGRELIVDVQPDIIAIGSDWARKDYYKQIDVDQDFLDTMGIDMLYLPYTKGVSSTDLKGRLKL